MVESTQNPRARTLVALIEGSGACVAMFGALAMKAPDNPVGWAWNICLPLIFGGLAVTAAGRAFGRRFDEREGK